MKAKTRCWSKSNFCRFINSKRICLFPQTFQTIRDYREQHLMLSQLPRTLSEILCPLLLIDCLATGLLLTSQIFITYVIFDSMSASTYGVEISTFTINNVVFIGRLIHTCLLVAWMEGKVIEWKTIQFPLSIF
jgi:Na+-transporting NADH:ubiquinone oxidoreductase subunit NqrB